MIRSYKSIMSLVRTLVLSGVIVSGSLTSPVSAFDLDFFQNNDIFFYNPDSQCVSGASSSTGVLNIPSLVGNDNAEKIWRFLVEKGLSAEQAAGVMGNIHQESNFDPAVEQANGVGFGIVQWSYERRTALEAAAREQNVAVSDLGFQLAYLHQESSSRTVDSAVLKYAGSRDWGQPGDNEWETLKKQKTVEDAMLFFHYAFERSADTPQQVIQNRGSYAQNAYESFKSLTPGFGSGLANAVGGCSSFGGGNLIESLKAYAHPEYHPNNSSGPVPPPRAEYVEIATKLQNEGKWVGGGNIQGDPNQAGYPAIDCGGFVSILLTQSGFEPEYNYGLDMSKGASNQQYGQLPWAKENWTLIGNGGEINVSDLKPGDVAYSDGHTFVFVGQVEGFGSQYASASYSWWRAPMAAGSWNGGGESATNPEYVWYGKR